MTQTKTCPDCAAEYFAHIENCADCGAVLLLPEENKKVQDERKLCRDKILESPVAVREGDLKWLDELYNVLINAGIPCVVSNDDGCGKKCCGSSLRLLVSAQNAEEANELIERYYAEVHPEIQVSQELVGQGKCPACGSPVAPDTVECMDCGLTLLIIE